MSTGRAKKPADAGVGGGRPCSEGDKYTSRWLRGVLSRARPIHAPLPGQGLYWLIFSSRPLLDRSDMDPIWDKSGVYPLGITAGAGERREVHSGVDGDRGVWRNICTFIIPRRNLHTVTTAVRSGPSEGRGQRQPTTNTKVTAIM